MARLNLDSATKSSLQSKKQSLASRLAAAKAAGDRSAVQAIKAEQKTFKTEKRATLTAAGKVFPGQKAARSGSSSSSGTRSRPSGSSSGRSRSSSSSSSSSRSRSSSSSPKRSQPVPRSRPSSSGRPNPAPRSRKRY